MNPRPFSDNVFPIARKRPSEKNFLIPWERWIELIKHCYPSSKRGSPARGIEIMLRMYLMQNSDAAIEDAICDCYAMRKFLHMDFVTS